MRMIVNTDYICYVMVTILTEKMASKSFQNKYRQETRRIRNYDYGSDGIYFVTINTLNRVDYLGDIVATDYCPSKDIETVITTDNSPSLRFTDMGNIVNMYWNEIPIHYPYVELDAFSIMPNHLHGVLILHGQLGNGWHPNKFGVQSGNLGAIIRAFKSSVKRYANENEIEFAWQPRYFDRIIRSEKSLLNVRNYINNQIE